MHVPKTETLVDKRISQVQAVDQTGKCYRRNPEPSYGYETSPPITLCQCYSFPIMPMWLTIQTVWMSDFLFLCTTVHVRQRHQSRLSEDYHCRKTMSLPFLPENVIVAEFGKVRQANSDDRVHTWITSSAPGWTEPCDRPRRGSRSNSQCERTTTSRVGTSLIDWLIKCV